MLNPQGLLEYIDKQWEEEIIPSLSDYIKIPNKSPNFDSKWQEHGFMEEAVSHIAQWCKAHAPHNMKLEILRLPGRTPLLLMDIAGQTHETVLLYGHLDKQPEMSGWNEGLGPWIPALQDGKLYGRGSADDGYAVYAALTAIRAIQEQGLPHSRCLILIEASEESGSMDLPYYLEMIKAQMGDPKLIICLDSGAGNYEQLWITTSLRGNIVGNLSVELIHEGVHSGNASGIVADSFRVTRELLSRLEEEKTGEIKLAELQCEIPPGRINEAANCAGVLGSRVFTEFPFHPAVEPVGDNLQQLILNRTWRPALTITGAEGLPAIADAGNVLRPKTVLKLSMRIPPLVHAETAAKAMQSSLSQAAPYHAKVSFHVDSMSMGWNAPLLADWLSRAIQDASHSFYQKPAMFMGEGGTIPFMFMLGEKFPNAQFMITGVLGPHANAHGPNEFLHLGMAKKLTACVAYVLHQQFLHSQEMQITS
ncbi:M20 family metallopeptidase [Legionella sp. 27cVA30]|uniref:M20 family metallopeptidase n=1 Tax=Legionella sp. 27cVA30 TaxID=2905657 RepID=UPI00209E2D71|nr:M20 family metallopeptidase [Legionella sp. 27cVA30]MCP0912932.1 M20 family metallopeptidase [Legionella sp. 27cVA30]